MLQARVHCLTHSLIWTLIPAMIIGCSNQTPGSGNKPGTPAGTSAGQTVSVPHFNGERAFGYLTAQTGFGPRSPNSPGHDACLAYLHQKLRTLADEVRLQEFTHPGYGGTMLRLTNVIAAFRPEAASRILLCAHWDTRPRADQDLPSLGLAAHPAHRRR